MEEGFYIIFNRNASVAVLTLVFIWSLEVSQKIRSADVFQLMLVQSVGMIVKNYP